MVFLMVFFKTFIHKGDFFYLSNESSSSKISSRKMSQGVINTISSAPLAKNVAPTNNSSYTTNVVEVKCHDETYIEHCSIIKSRS